MTIRITDDTPTHTVLELVEARTRRLMAELHRTPNAWPHRAERADLAHEIELSLDEYLELTGG